MDWLKAAQQLRDEGEPGVLVTVAEVRGHAPREAGAKMVVGRDRTWGSVGGGNLEKNVSPNLVSAIQLARQAGASVIGVVGRDGGYTAKEATACVIVPTVNPTHVTPHSEAFQAVVWHLLVSHPLLKAAPTKWESTR